jgi:hypothetical protein
MNSLGHEKCQEVNTAAPGRDKYITDARKITENSKTDTQGSTYVELPRYGTVRRTHSCLLHLRAGVGGRVREVAPLPLHQRPQDGQEPLQELQDQADHAAHGPQVQGPGQASAFLYICLFSAS